MKALLIATLLLCFCSVSLFAQGAGASKLQKFQLWEKLDKSDKFTFLLGFTNGLLASRVTVLQCDEITPAKREQLQCVLASEELDPPQATAMIDKYYKENPEKWNEPIGLAMIDALTVNGGPCGVTAPKK
jgi:hypothetical protein